MIRLEPVSLSVGALTGVVVAVLAISALHLPTLLAAQATSLPGFAVWTHGVPTAGSPAKLQFRTHSWALAHREASGEVESHESRDIVMFVTSGEATLVSGNDVVDPHRTGPDEVRGSSIRNATTQKVAPGDVINMPAGLPHQFLLEPGEQLTYVDVVIPSPK